jgi:hypothetical protein
MRHILNCDRCARRLINRKRARRLCKHADYGRMQKNTILNLTYTPHCNLSKLGRYEFT